MKIGYPCLNRTLGCTSSRTFRLKSYSPERLVETVAGNLSCLMETLGYNVEHGLLFFRITSDLVPFASHPACRYDWARRFGEDFQKAGRFIKRNGFRISMHPDQFTLINSPDRGVHRRSLRELAYHVRVLDLMRLDATAKVQIHVGGVYGDRARSIKRFIRRFASLDGSIRRRLVIENDDVCYPVFDCLLISRETGVPVLFDSFHHSIKNRGEPALEALRRCAATWRRRDGAPMVDYSRQKKGARRGSHAESLHTPSFRRFLEETEPLDFDLMLEIKDKEKSALRAAAAAAGDPRFRGRRALDRARARGPRRKGGVR